MIDQGLWCEFRVPLNWNTLDSATTPTGPIDHEAWLLLTAINQMESTHDYEPGNTEHRRLERMEAKLDLALYLLARTLEPAGPSTQVEVRLSPEEIQWQEARPPAEGTPLLLELRPSAALPLSLRLPAMALLPQSGFARASLIGLGACRGRGRRPARPRGGSGRAARLRPRP